MIVLTGVSGGLGGAVLETILDQNLIDPKQLVISSYSSKGPIFERARAAGIEIRHGNLKEPETLVKSYTGADALFLVSYPSVGEERYNYHKNAINAAILAGVKHVLYTSLTWGGPEGESSVAGVFQAHRQTMDYLKDSGLTYTFIRESTYAHLWNNFAGFLDVNQSSPFEVVISNDGPHHWANRKELGEATAKIVVDYPNYTNQLINLTGPRSFSVEDIVKLYADYSGRQVTVRKVGLDEAVAYHKQKQSVPPEQQDFLSNWASWGEGLALGEAGYIDPTFEKLLGRRPLDIIDMQDEIFAKTNALDTKDFV